MAGIITHADSQWIKINSELNAIAAEFIDQNTGVAPIFHAKDIFHGTKYFHRDRFPENRRKYILESLAMLPKRFDIPVVAGVCQKDELIIGSSPDERKISRDALPYAVAFGSAVTMAEYWLHSSADNEEVGAIVAEDLPEMRRHVKWGVSILNDKRLSWNIAPELTKCLPFSRIVEGPLFAQKAESPFLQLADFIAFTFCRQCSGGAGVFDYIRRYFENIVTVPSLLSSSLK